MVRLSSVFAQQTVRGTRMAKMIRIPALALVALVAFSASSQAQNSPFYSGKTITLLVPSAAAGGYDTYARTLARHYPKHIPGRPQIIVQNVPAGGGIVAANNLFNLSPRDGTAIGMLASSSLLVAALGERLAKFENPKFTPIGNMSEESDTCSVWHTSGIANSREFLTKEVIIGSEGVGSNSHTFPLGMNDVLGAKLKVVPGYRGTQLRFAAMERGELHGACGIFVSTLSSLFEKQLAEGTLRVVLQMGLSRNPKFKDVPNALELASDEDGRAALALMFAQLALGRPIFAPPEVPRDRAAVLSEAFAATMRDPEFLADAEKMKIDAHWFGPERMTEVIAQMDVAPEPVKARVRKILAIEESK
jgi:tripartite-type tricarboxylate transporter receptor subunit TctC